MSESEQEEWMLWDRKVELDKKVAELEEDLITELSMKPHYIGQISKLNAALAKKDAEIEKLRGALEQITEFEAWSMPDSYSDDAAEEMVKEISGIAHQALTPPTTEESGDET